MESKYNECTTKALEDELVRVSEQYKNLSAELDRRRKEDAERKEAELALAKKSREEEIRAVGNHYIELVNAFVEDYGYFENYWSWFSKR